MGRLLVSAEIAALICGSAPRRGSGLCRFSSLPGWRLRDTREAFTQVLLGKLSALLGQSLPTVLPEATRDAACLT
jgi:hypothetical protein